MSWTTEPRSSFRRAMWIGSAWFFVAVVAAVQNYLSLRLAGKPVSILHSALWHLPILSVWAVATPLIFRSVRRKPFIGIDWKRNAPLHVLRGLAFVILLNAAWPILYPAAVSEWTLETWAMTTAANLTRWLPLALIVYLVIGGIGHAVAARTSRDASPEKSNPTGSSFRKNVDRLTIRGLNRSFVVPTTDIDWIEAAGDYVIYHVGTKKMKERRTLKAVHRLLDPARFVRIHRSTVVCVERIREIHPLQHGDYVVFLEDGEQLRLSRSRRSSLEAALGRSI